ncbi:FAD-binding oxidoreductase [Rhodopirellula sp. ICT_H3.1]|uniref:D-amino-acid oxidase n=1 Tax=Aporhodopirellula aestuarii TaxID=2950107 RepID=A0ABT0UB61_9BACT|nr:FAD-binding oxidoreductase [Aporhodopirellula aestuarii]
MKTKRIAVVGQGVIGLASALRLIERGFSVEIFSKEELAATTSMSAGAYWWPHKAYPQNRIVQWAKSTHEEYVRLRADSDSGVHFEKHFRFCIDPDDSAYVLELVEHWEKIDGARYGVPCGEAYLVVLPVIDVPIFVTRLRERVTQHANIHIAEIGNPSELFPDFDLVVNCTGVWAREFVNDPEVFPIRGQVVRVSRPEGLRESTRIYQNDDALTLVLPRSSDVILGGTSENGNWDRNPSEADTADIIRRCSELVPKISDCEVLGTTVGLRPGRREVRLELEMLAEHRPVIHNYGHGGGGYTVAWGCADEVAEIASDYFAALSD